MTPQPADSRVKKEKRKPPQDIQVYNPKQRTNLRKKAENIFSKLQKQFKNNPHINEQALGKKGVVCIYTNGQKLEEFDQRVVICDDNGDVDVAFYKNILSTLFVEHLEHLFKEAYFLRSKEEESKKKTIYTGLWAKMNPMNYISKDNDKPSGQFVIKNILPLLAPIAKILMEATDIRTLEFYTKLDDRAKFNGFIFPCSATNFLTKDSDEHRVLKPHRDYDDYSSTLIVYAGKGTAKLNLPNQLTSFNTERGDVLVFKGKKFAHVVDTLATDTEEMRISLVLFGHTSLKTKPIYLAQKEEALEMHDRDYPEEAKKRIARRLEKKRKQALKEQALKEKALRKKITKKKQTRRQK